MSPSNIRRNFEQLRVTVSAARSMYSNGLMQCLMHEDSLGNAGEGAKSMVRNLDYNAGLEDYVSAQNQRIAIAFRLSLSADSPWKSYTAALNDQNLTIGSLSKSTKVLTGTAECLAALTIPLSIVGGIAFLCYITGH